MRLRIGYPDASSEREILPQREADNSGAGDQVLSASKLLNLQDAGRHVKVDDSLADYLLAIVEKTRTHESLTLGVSPRGSQALYRAAQARALLEGRNYAIPDDVKRLAIAVFGHCAVAMSEIRL